eukprot:766758-Hanusia_phi.AAC.4
MAADVYSGIKGWEDRKKSKSLSACQIVSDLLIADETFRPDVHAQRRVKTTSAANCWAFMR